MKKVGIICNLMTSYGGVQTCVISLIKGLNQQGITPVLLSDNMPKKALWEEQDLQCETKRIKYSISVDTYKKYIGFLKVIWEFVFFFKTSWLEEKYDFIYIFQPNVMVNTNQKHLFYLSMSPRALNYSKRPFLSKIKTKIYTLFLSKFHPIFEFQNYNCVINSEYTARMFYDFYGKKLDVIYPSNSMTDILNVSAKKTPKSIIYLSRIAKDKKPHLMLELAREHKDYHFYILGSINETNPYYQYLRNKINSINLKNVELLINLPYEKVVNYLARSEYYVFFAENEHFGITTVEAVLNQCIPFVHNSGGQKEIVPFDELRFEYDTLNESFEKLISMNSNQKENILNKMEVHINNFKEKVFIEEMISYLALG